MKIVLNDTMVKAGLYPFGMITPIAQIRIGILTIKEKWERITGAEVFDSLQSFEKAKIHQTEKPSLFINANIIPSIEWWKQIQATINIQESGILELGNPNLTKTLRYPWNIFQYNDWALQQDFEVLTQGRISQPIPASNKVICPEKIFIETGATVEHSILNATDGSIYIGKNAVIMEGCMIRGAFSLGENAVLKMGTKIYGAVTIGPQCTAGGEIKNSILMGYSNKAHDGYLGDSVIGCWCNLGAGTTNSNVKNTASTIKMWDHQTRDFLPVGVKAGLIMGDFSRAAINTNFNTGTLVGICCNIFDTSFPPKYIPNFTWGNERYILEKVFQDINNWKKFKGQTITVQEKIILEYLYSKST